MIVTDHFVYVHVSRSAGTFLNKLIREQVPGAKMLQYHGHLRDLPEEFAYLPVIGFVRNPWDWYVSMISDYARKQQYVYQVISNRGALDFEATATRFLTLGDGSDEHKRLLRKLATFAPRVIETQRPPRSHLPGLRSEHFRNYPDGIGYYSWLVDLMFATERETTIHFGRFENLREDALRLLEETGVEITPSIREYLAAAEPLNTSERDSSIAECYGAELRQLVADKDRELIERFGYRFPAAGSE